MRAHHTEIVDIMHLTARRRASGLPAGTSKPPVAGSSPAGRARVFEDRRDELLTTIRGVLGAVSRGEPTALRMAVEALGTTLELLDDAEDARQVDDGTSAPSVNERGR